MTTTFEQAEAAVQQFTKLPCYNPHIMHASVGCEDRAFCVKVNLSQRIDVDELPKEVASVGIYYAMGRR